MIPTRSLSILRIALLSGVLLFGLAAFTVGPQLQGSDSDDLFSVLRLAFAGLAIGSLAILKYLQPKVAASEHDAALKLTIVAWAIAEGAAFLGAIILLMTGVAWPYIAGVGIMLTSFVLFPVPTEQSDA